MTAMLRNKPRGVVAVAGAALLGAALLAGCGGGDGEGESRCEQVCDCTCGGGGGSCVADCVEQCEASVETYDDCLELQGVLAFMCQDECEAAFAGQASQY